MRIFHWFWGILRRFVFRSEPLPSVAEMPAAPRPKRRKPDVSQYEKNRMKYDKFLSIPVGAPNGQPATAKTKDAAPNPSPKPDNEPELIGPTMPTIVQDTKEGSKVEFKLQEFRGEFTFRDTILDQLELYFYYIRRMKKRDKDAYSLYKRVGANVLPYASYAHDRAELQYMGKISGETDTNNNGSQKVPLHFMEILPTFGCFAYGTDPIVESMERAKPVKGKVKWIPKFLWFEKIEKTPVEIQRFFGKAVYRITVFWDRPFDKAVKKDLGKGGIPQQYVVGIDSERTIHALRIHQPTRVHIRGKVRQNGHKDGDFSRYSWRYPSYFSLGKHETSKAVLENVFRDVAGWYDSRSVSEVLVSVKNKTLTAVFGINAERAPYFFADRDLIVDELGRKVKVFHAVKAHTRVRSDGTMKVVPRHYRGIRRFP